jgi:uncharacterized membrane protein YkoI
MSMTKASWLMLCAAFLAGTVAIGSAMAADEAKTKPTLPDAVAKAFKTEFPKGEIVKADEEKENGITVYDIEFKEGGVARETDIAADGTILEAATVVDAKAVPAAVLKAITAAAEGGTVGKIEKIEIRCEAKDGKITKLEKAKTTFEAALKKGDQTGEVVVDEKGAVVEAPTWVKEGTKK